LHTITRNSHSTTALFTLSLHDALPIWAIVFHIAERHAGLLPDGANARSRAITWMFAALNTVEPPILELVTAKILEGDKPWSQERDRKSTRLNSSHRTISYAVFCLKKKR